jgi:hypothetical protein
MASSYGALKCLTIWTSAHAAIGMTTATNTTATVLEKAIFSR